MRITLSMLAVLLATAVCPSSVFAQVSLPYRRTIESRPYRPYEWTGRYVRINVSFSGGMPAGNGRITNSMTVQSTINAPGGGGMQLVGSSSGGNTGDALGGGGAGGGAAGAGRSALSSRDSSSIGLGRSFRFGR
jgi:hypothetical protein